MNSHGEGIHTTSFIESLWNSLKSHIKKTYHIIPSKNIFSFQIKNKNKSYNLLIKLFFDYYRYIENLKDIILNENDFLSDEDLSNENEDLEIV